MSPAIVNFVCALAILLAAVQAVTPKVARHAAAKVEHHAHHGSHAQHAAPKVASVEVDAAAKVAHHTHQAHHARHAHHATKGPLHSLVKGDAEEDWHVHGEKGSQWRWVKSTGNGGWEKKTITDEEAKDAEAPAPPPAAHTPAAPPAQAPATTADTTCTIKGAGKVNIDVYYESRCPGCLMFIAKTLEPLWRTKGMQDFLNVTMYTYGNGRQFPTAQISEAYKFFHPDTTGKGFDHVQICQHGPEECFGNLVQVCAQDIAEHPKYMDLVFCMAKSTMLGYGEENGAYKCLEQTKIDKDKVRDCMTGPRGNQLASEAGVQTDLLKDRLGTPWVMMAGAHASDEALMNHTLLTQQVCSHFCDVPEVCSPFVKLKAPSPAHAAPAHAAPAPAPDAGDDFTVLVNAEEDDGVGVHLINFETKDDFFQVSHDRV